MYFRCRCGIVTVRRSLLRVTTGGKDERIGVRCVVVDVEPGAEEIVVAMPLEAKELCDFGGEETEVFEVLQAQRVKLAGTPVAEEPLVLSRVRHHDMDLRLPLPGAGGAASLRRCHRSPAGSSCCRSG